MELVFDCFFEEILKTIERSGLKTRQNRQNVIDQLDSIILGCSAGISSIKLKTLFSLYEFNQAVMFHMTKQVD